MLKDNWPTHGDTHTCRFCAFYVQKKEGPTGRCRRHAPTMGGFPVVFPSDSCGDHKLDNEPLRVVAAISAVLQPVKFTARKRR